LEVHLGRFDEKHVGKILGRIVYQICLEGLDYKMSTSNKETMYTMKLNLVKEMDRVGKGDKGNNATSSRSTIIAQCDGSMKSIPKCVGDSNSK